MHAGICLHLHVISGRDPHHIAEAEFKALAREEERFAVEPDARRRHSQHEGRAVMSDDKDDLNGFDGLGKTNDDGNPQSSGRFEEDEVLPNRTMLPRRWIPRRMRRLIPMRLPTNRRTVSDADAENSLSFDDELQGLLGNRAKVAVIITRLASARLFAAFCQLSDISAQCLASPQGAVAVLRNLDGDGPEAAIKDMTTVVAGMPAVLAINRADKLEATMYLQGKVGQTFAPPVLLTSTAPFVEDLLLGITDQGCVNGGNRRFRKLDPGCGRPLAEHTRFGRGSSSIDGKRFSPEGWTLRQE